MEYPQTHTHTHMHTPKPRKKKNVLCYPPPSHCLQSYFSRDSKDIMENTDTM